MTKAWAERTTSSEAISKPLVWVIEDNTLKAETILALLEFSGYRTAFYPSHRRAVDHIYDKDKHPDIILCDFETEDRYSADWFMEQLKKSGAAGETKVIGISGSEALNKRLIECGADCAIDSTDLVGLIDGSQGMMASSSVLRSHIEGVLAKDKIRSL